MKLVITLGERTLETEFTVANGAVKLTHGQQSYEAQISQPEPGIFTVILNQRVFRCVLNEVPGGQPEVVVNGQRFPVTVHDKKHLRGKAGAAAASGKAVLVAPMPGKVARVLCAAGDEIAAHQGVLVVEAMKMQNEVQTPKAGKVVEIRVNAGQTVNAGEVLAVVE